MTEERRVENGTYKVGRATAIIGIFALVAKILGLVRDAVLSNKFGTNEVVDAYFAAFRLPDFIFNLLILGTFSVAFIPVFSEYLIKDKKKAYELASSILNFTVIGMLALTLVAFIFFKPLVALLAPGLAGETRHLTEVFTRIFLLSPLLLTLSSVISSILNTEKRFTSVSIAPVFYNASIIFGATILYDWIGVTGLAWGVVIGALLHLATQLPELLQLKFKYSLSINYKDVAFIKFWKLYWPRIFSMGANQVTLLIATFFGSYLATGALSSFYYANNLQSVFLGIFAVSFSIAVFPMLADLYNKGDENGFKDVIAKTTNQILFLIMPLATLMIVLRAQIVRLLLGIGAGTAFSFEDTRLVSLNLGLFAISIFAQSLIPLYSRAFFARHNTITPMVIGFITIVANAIATYYFVGQFGIPGMALAFSVTSILNLVLLLMELHHRIGSIRDEYLILNAVKIVIASLCGGIFAYIMLYVVAPMVNMQTYWGVLIQASISAIIGISVYLFTAWLLKADDSDHIYALLKSAVTKSTRTLSAFWSFWS